MPLVRLETNNSLADGRDAALRQGLAAAIAAITGDPVAEIRVEIAANAKMRMADSDEPMAHVEIRRVEIPKERADELTAAVCPVLDSLLGVRDHRVYIAVVTTRNSMWRVNGTMK